MADGQKVNVFQVRFMPKREINSNSQPIEFQIANIAVLLLVHLCFMHL